MTHNRSRAAAGSAERAERLAAQPIEQRHVVGRRRRRRRRWCRARAGRRRSARACAAPATAPAAASRRRRARATRPERVEDRARQVRAGRRQRHLHAPPARRAAATRISVSACGVPSGAWAKTTLRDRGARRPAVERGVDGGRQLRVQEDRDRARAHAVEKAQRQRLALGRRRCSAAPSPAATASGARKQRRVEHDHVEDAIAGGAAQRSPIAHFGVDAVERRVQPRPLDELAVDVAGEDARAGPRAATSDSRPAPQPTSHSAPAAAAGSDAATLSAETSNASPAGWRRRGRATAARAPAAAASTPSSLDEPERDQRRALLGGRRHRPSAAAAPFRPPPTARSSRPARAAAAPPAAAGNIARVGHEHRRARTSGLRFPMKSVASQSREKRADVT